MPDNEQTLHDPISDLDLVYIGHATTVHRDDPDSAVAATISSEAQFVVDLSSLPVPGIEEVRALFEGPDAPNVKSFPGPKLR
jgi:hypothetical protein